MRFGNLYGSPWLYLNKVDLILIAYRSLGFQVCEGATVTEKGKQDVMHVDFFTTLYSGFDKSKANVCIPRVPVAFTQPITMK